MRFDQLCPWQGGKGLHYIVIHAFISDGITKWFVNELIMFSLHSLVAYEYQMFDPSIVGLILCVQQIPSIMWGDMAIYCPQSPFCCHKCWIVIHITVAGFDVTSRGTTNKWKFFICDLLLLLKNIWMSVRVWFIDQLRSCVIFQMCAQWVCVIFLHYFYLFGQIPLKSINYSVWNTFTWILRRLCNVSWMIEVFFVGICYFFLFIINPTVLRDF